MQFRDEDSDFDQRPYADCGSQYPDGDQSKEGGETRGVGGEEIWAEVLLPSQLFFRSRAGHRGDRELNLMAAVLIDAIVCYQNGRHRASRQAYREYLDARNWIESRDASRLFTFENVCDALGLDPGAIRHRLKVLTRGGEQVLSLGERRRHQRN